MNVVTYHYNTSGSVCSILIKDEEVLDVSTSNLSNADNVSKTEFVEKGTRMSSGLARRHGINGTIVFCYPSVLKGNKQEDIARPMFSNVKELKFSRHPLSIPSSIAKISKETYIRPLYNNLKNPVRVYTDASVQKQNGKPTLGVAILDDNNSLVSFLGSTLNNHRSVSEAEFEAGCAGLEYAIQEDIQDVIWVSDNRDSQSLFRERKSTAGFKTQNDIERATRIKQSFDDFSIKDIDGNDNIFADAIAEDVRREETRSSILYESPYILDN